MNLTHLNRLKVFYLYFLAILFFIPSMGHTETLRIAVAANFTDVTREIVPLFEQTTGHTVKVSFGSTGKLYAQIVHGAPFDLFLAADAARPQRLVEEGYAVEKSRFTYARGKLVLWSADASYFGDGETLLYRGDFNRLAIANPKTAPYGMAAQQVLQHLDVKHLLKSKLVYGDSIAQTFQFTATGNANIGLIAASQAQAWTEPASLWVIPDSYYKPISQQAVSAE